MSFVYQYIDLLYFFSYTVDAIGKSGAITVPHEFVAYRLPSYVIVDGAVIINSYLNLFTFSHHSCDRYRYVMTPLPVILICELIVIRYLL